MRTLLIRLGAFGDVLAVTPLVRFLKEKGNEVYFLGSEQAQEILQNNPYVDKFIYHKRDSVPADNLGEYFKNIKRAYECNEMIDLCESYECKIILHPAQPQYNWTKQERMALCNRNIYDLTFELAGYPQEKGHLPEMYFTEDEKQQVAQLVVDYLGSYKILWVLSGSSLHKAYPYTAYVLDRLLKKYPDMIIFTVGDEKCQILETELNNERIIHLSGKISVRQTCLLCKYMDLIISPETGILHASGMYDTPKIGMFTHTTPETITKYFKNDYSMQAKVSCSPCFQIKYEANIQCPIDPVTSAPWCVAFGFDADRVIEKIEEVYEYSRNPLSCVSA